MSQENIPNDRILRLVAQIERADEIGAATGDVGRRDAVRGPLMDELTTLVADYPEALPAVAEWVSPAMLRELGREDLAAPAALIAAAPDMLEALEALEEFMGDTYMKARAAVQKARGEA